MPVIWGTTAKAIIRLRERKRCKGYVKIHVEVDIQPKEVSEPGSDCDGKTPDSGELKPLVKKARRQGDGQESLGRRGYDTHDNFEF